MRRPSLPGLTPQVGFTRLAALKIAELGQARVPVQVGFTRLAALKIAELGQARVPVQVGFTRLAALKIAELGQARVPVQCVLFAKKMDARVISAFTRVRSPSKTGVNALNDALLPAHDGESAAHTITLPSSVMASSTLTVASPSSISLWARPEGIIGKQFSLGSTTQSKITGLFTPIISRMAPSTSPGRSQRMPTA